MPLYFLAKSSREAVASRHDSSLIHNSLTHRLYNWGGWQAYLPAVEA
jgi:hypothetical protein